MTVCCVALNFGSKFNATQTYFRAKELHLGATELGVTAQGGEATLPITTRCTLSIVITSSPLTINLRSLHKKERVITGKFMHIKSSSFLTLWAALDFDF